MNVIETNNLIKIYQQGDIEVKALNDVSINFQQGEFTAIVGPSGSGKTTFLNSIGGLDTPTSGKVVINNTDITNLKSNELIDFRLRNIGFVFQAYNLIPVLTAKENVEFIMLMQGDSASTRKLRAEELKMRWVCRIKLIDDQDNYLVVSNKELLLLELWLQNPNSSWQMNLLPI